MLISELSSRATPIVDYDDSDDSDQDDEVSVLYSNPPSNNKGKQIQIDSCIEDDDMMSFFGNKKRKFYCENDQLKARKGRTLNIDEELMFAETLSEKKQFEARRGRNLNIDDKEVISTDTLFEKEQLEAKKARNLNIHDQDLTFRDTIVEKEQLEAKKVRNLNIHDQDLTFRDTIVEKEQLEAKNVRNLNIEELIFTETLFEREQFDSNNERNLDIDEDGDEVEIIESKHEEDNVFGKFGVIEDETPVEKDHLKAKKEWNFDYDHELQLICSLPELYQHELDNSKHEVVDLFGKVGADVAVGDDEEVIFASSSSSKGKGISVDYNDDDEVQVNYSCPKIYLGESSNSKHENDNLFEKDDVDDAIGDLFSLVMCEICADEKPKIAFLTVMGCDHSYCSNCIARYVASKVEENVVEITCPVSECAGVLGPEYCRSILPAEVYDRWGLALCEEIISPPQKFYCPYKDCSALMIDDTQETREVITQMECPNCQRMFCVKCKVPWHNGVECAEFQRLNEDDRGQEDIMLVNLAKENLWKRCPECKMYVQRSQGCNAMRCRCGCCFCYACGNDARTCHCPGGYAHHIPIEPRLRQIQPTTPHVNPLFENLPENPTRASQPYQVPQSQVGLGMIAENDLQRRYLLNLSANQTVGGSQNNSQAGPRLSVSQARQVSVGGGLSIAQARQRPVINGLINTQAWQDLVIGGPNISQPRQNSVGGGLNIAQARLGGGHNNSEARQGHVINSLNNSQAWQDLVIGGPNISQPRQGSVGGGLNIAQARQGPVGGGHNNSEARQGPV